MTTVDIIDAKGKKSGSAELPADIFDVETNVPLLPICMDGERLGLRLNPPRLGEHSEAVLKAAGLDAAQIQFLIQKNIIAST